MKKFATFITLLVTIQIHAQWVQQSTNVIQSLIDVYCISDDVVVVVGFEGVILKTIDGGLNWIQKTSGTTNALNRVQFVNTNVGYTVGENGTLLKTINAGESWSIISTGDTANLTGLSCIDENTFYIAENGGYVKKTINGGSSFNEMNLDGAGFRNDIQFINESVGYANTSEGLYKTENAGNSWSVIYLDVFSIFFLNENVGFINASDGLSKTTDGGGNFTNLDFIPYGVGKLFATTSDIVWGVSRSFILGGPTRYTMRGEITDLGEFQRIDSSQPILTSVYFTNPTNGYAVGPGIYKNTTGIMLGVEDIIADQNINIYPNPASTQITISSAKMLKIPFTVEIIDPLGKVLYSKEYINQENINIPTGSFLAGTYFIKIENQESKLVRKLILN